MATNIENKLTSTLKTNIKDSPEFNKLPTSVKRTLESSINTSVDSFAPDLFKNVDVESNKQLDEVPKNLIGNKNPLDLVTSNLQPAQLSNTLTPLITDKLAGPLTSQLFNSITNDFANKLPPGVASTLNLPNLLSVLTNLSSNAVTKGLNFSLDSISSAKFDTPLPIPATIEDVDSIFQTQGDNALEAIDEQFSASISTKAIREAQSFDVQSLENQEKLVTQTVGFIDPEATYPTKEYQERTEINKLATGDVNGTIVQIKDSDRKKSIKLPENQYWEQPPVPYKGQYPYNKVTQTESGHIIEIDDTPGAERLQIYHRTGTFVEIDSTGSVVKRTKGSSYEIIDRNGYISVTGDCNLSVKGGTKIYVGNDADIEVEGDVNLKCFNDITMQAGGRIDMSATEEINLRSANINFEADVDLSMKGDVNLFLHTTDMYLKANNNIKVQTLNNMFTRAGNNMFMDSKNNFNIVSGTNMFAKAGSSFNMVAGSSWFARAGSQVNLQAGSTINMDGSQTFIQSGTSSAAADATVSQDSLYAYASNIGYIGTRKDIIYETITNPVAPNFLDSLGLTAEDAELPEESKKQEQQLKQFGVVSDSDLNQRAVEIKRESPSSKVDTVIKSSDSLLAQTYLPENYQLSKHFTLGSLTTKAAVSKYPLQPQLGLTYGQIAYNLQGIALNVLEPLLALYPKMLVTSAFRSASNSSSTSDHPRGKAVDLQFPGYSKEMYFEIAKKLAENLNYDKLLLEYKTYGTGNPWIHISFDVNLQRKIVLTYFNDRKYGDGLVNLA